VIWNLHKYLLEMTALNEVSLVPLDRTKKLAQEERYVLSKLHSLVGAATERMDLFKFNSLPPLICEFSTKTLSHWFVQTNW
jgi:isoleucyl-tRNA synthetase